MPPRKMYEGVIVDMPFSNEFACINSENMLK